MTLERVKQAFTVNIIAMFGLVIKAIPHMKPGSAVVTSSSIQAYQPSNPILDYASTKVCYQHLYHTFILYTIQY